MEVNSIVDRETQFAEIQEEISFQQEIPFLSNHKMVILINDQAQMILKESMFKDPKQMKMIEADIKKLLMIM